MDNSSDSISTAPKKEAPITLDLLKYIKGYYRKGEYLYRPHTLRFSDRHSNNSFYKIGERITFNQEKNYYSYQEDIMFFESDSSEEITKVEYLQHFKAIKDYYYEIHQKFFALLKLENNSPYSDSDLRNEILTCLKYRNKPQTYAPHYPVTELFVLYAPTSCCWRIFKLDLYKDVEYIENEMVIKFEEYQITLQRKENDTEFNIYFFSKDRRIESHNFDDSFGRHFSSQIDKFYLLTKEEYENLFNFITNPPPITLPERI